jgi:hypothetical protein
LLLATGFQDSLKYRQEIVPEGVYSINIEKYHIIARIDHDRYISRLWPRAKKQLHEVYLSKKSFVQGTDWKAMTSQGDQEK